MEAACSWEGSEVTRAADTYQKASMRGTPDGLQRGIHLQHLDDRDDALGSVGAFAPKVEPTELVIAHAARGHKRASVSTAMGCSRLSESEHVRRTCVLK